jgi:hypothetical protein
MPKTSKGGEPIEAELPGTIRRSPKKAQDTFAKAQARRGTGRARPVDDDQGTAGRGYRPQAEVGRAS